MAKDFDGMCEGIEQDPVFEPLFRAVARLDIEEAEWDGIISNYMFMFVEDGRFAYKHRGTRQYVHLDAAGEILGGILNTKND